MKKVIYVGVGKLIISVISIILLRVYSDHLSLAELGIITLLINFDSFFGLVYASPFGNYLSLSALSDLREKSVHQRISSYTSITLLSAIACLVFFLVYLLFFEIDLSLFLCLLFIVYLWANNSAPILSSVLTVINRAEVSMVLQVIKSVCGLAGFLIVFLFAGGVKGWIIGAAVGALLPAIINMVYCRKLFSDQKASYFTLKGFISKEDVLKYIVPFALMQLALWFMFNSYRMYAGKLFDMDYLGQLGIAFIFASQFCSAFDSVLVQVYLADFYRLIDSTSDTLKLQRFGIFLKKTQAVYLLFLTLGFIPFVVAFSFLMKPEYVIDYKVLFAAWLFNFMRISFNLFGLITQVLRRPRMVTVYVAGGVVISLLVFMVIYLSKIAVGRDWFLLGVCLLPAMVIMLFVEKVGKKTGISSVVISFLALPIVFAAAGILLLKNGWLASFFAIDAVWLITISSVLLAVVGACVLYLLKSLKRINL